MASQKNDNNSKMEMVEEVHGVSPSSEENADTTAHAPSPNSSAPNSTPTIQGGVEDQRRGTVATAGGVTSMEVASGGEAQNVQQITPVSGDESAVEKKKGERVEEPGASSSGRNPKKPRKRRDFNDQPQRPPGCYICGKMFKSWRAVFGHMGAHRISEGRQRGALPPPVFTPSGENPPVEAGSGDGGGDDVPREVLQEQLVPTLLNIAQEVLTSSASTSQRADGLDIDLNKPIVDEDEDEEEEGGGGGGGGGQFDLNKFLPWKDKEGDKDKDGGAAPK